MARALVLALLLHACASAPAPAPQPVVVAPASAEPATEPSAPPAERAAPAEEPLGIRDCDEYLALYRDCEPKLAGEIAAGNRRAYRAERARLVYLKSSDEAPALPSACGDMLRELEQVCR
ncbi:MAG: hypothetical protein HS104_32080 [Polyangiaceae bacterium]|nr:hypothetical protein [Polyangiaceae bacterium]